MGVMKNSAYGCVNSIDYPNQPSSLVIWVFGSNFFKLSTKRLCSFTNGTSIFCYYTKPSQGECRSTIHPTQLLERCIANSIPGTILDVDFYHISTQPASFCSLWYLNEMYELPAGCPNNRTLKILSQCSRNPR